MNYSMPQNHTLTDTSTDCIPLSALQLSQLASVVAVIVVASLALGFLLFIFFLTCREAKTVKYNIRRLSDIERESFSTRRTSRCGVLEVPKTEDGRRLTLDDLYVSILPEYTNVNEGSERDFSVQDTQQISSVAWQLDEDPEPDQRSDDPDVVLRQLFFPGEFLDSDFRRHRQTATDDSGTVTPRRKASSVKQKVKRSIHQMRYSLHSTNSLADVASKSSIASFNEVQNNEDATVTPDQVHHHQLSLGPFSDLGRNRRNGSVPAQLYSHTNSNSINNNNSERKPAGGGILRRNSSRLQADFEQRMKQRRVAVSFNSSGQSFSPKNSFLVKNGSEESGTAYV